MEPKITTARTNFAEDERKGEGRRLQFAFEITVKWWGRGDDADRQAAAGEKAGMTTEVFYSLH